MEAFLTHVPKAITWRFLFSLNVQIFFLRRKIFTQKSSSSNATAFSDNTAWNFPPKIGTLRLKVRKKNWKRFCFRNKILRIFFCGQLEWSFNITAKNISTKVPEMLGGTKTKKNIYKKILTSKIPPKNWNCLPTKLLKKNFNRISEFSWSSLII